MWQRQLSRRRLLERLQDLGRVVLNLVSFALLPPLLSFPTLTLAMLRLLMLLSLVAALSVGCSATKSPNPTDEPLSGEAVTPVPGDEETPPPEDVVSGVATVRYLDLEGGFYGLVADADSARYIPSNLEGDYQQDGLRVRFRAQLQEGMMTTQQWGRPVELLDIMELEE